MDLVCRVATFTRFVVHQVLKDFIFMTLNHICDSAVSHGEYATSIASRGVRESAGYTEILQVGNLLLNDVNATANVTRPALYDDLGLHRLLMMLLLLMGHATL